MENDFTSTRTKWSHGSDINANVHCAQKERLFFITLLGVADRLDSLIFGRECSPFLARSLQERFLSVVLNTFARRKRRASSCTAFWAGQDSCLLKWTKETGGGDTISPVLVTVELVRSRIRLDFRRLRAFEKMWCYQNELCWLEGDGLLFGELLDLCVGVRMCTFHGCCFVLFKMLICLCLDLVCVCMSSGYVPVLV